MEARVMTHHDGMGIGRLCNATTGDATMRRQLVTCEGCKQIFAMLLKAKAVRVFDGDFTGFDPSILGTEKEPDPHLKRYMDALTKARETVKLFG
jgi:hypothetical protein